MSLQICCLRVNNAGNDCTYHAIPATRELLEKGAVKKLLPADTGKASLSGCQGRKPSHCGLGEVTNRYTSVPIEAADKRGLLSPQWRDDHGSRRRVEPRVPEVGIGRHILNAKPVSFCLSKTRRNRTQLAPEDWVSSGRVIAIRSATWNGLTMHGMRACWRKARV